MNKRKIINTNKNLTTTELYLINFINANPETFIKKTSGQIASQANVSPSAITRLTKKLGFENLKALQIVVGQRYQEFLKTQKHDLQLDLYNNLNETKLTSFFLIEDFLNYLDLKSLQKVIDKILTAKKILVFQTKETEEVSNLFTLNLIKLGINAISSSNFPVQLIFLNKIKKTDFVLIFCPRFPSKELIYFVRKAMQLELEFVLIVAQENKLIFENNLNCIVLPTTNEQETINQINYQIFSMLICKIICQELYKSLSNKKSKIIRKNTMILEKWQDS